MQQAHQLSLEQSRIILGPALANAETLVAAEAEVLVSKEEAYQQMSCSLDNPDACEACGSWEWEMLNYKTPFLYKNGVLFLYRERIIILSPFSYCANAGNKGVWCNPSPNS